MPSSNIDSSCTSTSTAVASVVTHPGKVKVPRSSRFVTMVKLPSNSNATPP
jgi:hypothetical protein